MIDFGLPTLVQIKQMSFFFLFCLLPWPHQSNTEMTALIFVLSSLVEDGHTGSASPSTGNLSECTFPGSVVLCPSGYRNVTHYFILYGTKQEEAHRSHKREKISIWKKLISTVKSKHTQQKSASFLYCVFLHWQLINARVPTYVFQKQDFWVYHSTESMGCP